MRFFILTLLVASAMAQQQNTQWTKEQYDQWQEAQARQGFGYVFFKQIVYFYVQKILGIIS